MPYVKPDMRGQQVASFDFWHRYELKDEELDQTVTRRSLTKFTVKGTVMKSLIVTHQLKFPLFYGVHIG